MNNEILLLFIILLVSICIIAQKKKNNRSIWYKWNKELLLDNDDKWNRFIHYKGLKDTYYYLVEQWLKYHGDMIPKANIIYNVKIFIIETLE